MFDISCRCIAGKETCRFLPALTGEALLWVEIFSLRGRPHRPTLIALPHLPPLQPKAARLQSNAREKEAPKVDAENHA